MIKANAQLISQIKTQAAQLRGLLREHAGTLPHEQVSAMITNEITRMINIACGLVCVDGPIDWASMAGPIAEALTAYRHRVYVENYA